LRFSSTCVSKRTRNQIILIILITVIIFLIDKTVDGNGGFFVGYFSDILVDITIAKKGRIVDEKASESGSGTDREMEGKHFSNAYLI